MSMIGNFLALEQTRLDELRENPENIASFLHEEHATDIIDVDKAWHGIHFVLTGTQYGGEQPLANVVFGAEPISEEEVGYSPALGTSSDHVKSIAEALGQLTENDFRARFDAAALEAADIYPQIWDEGDEALDYLASYFVELKAFYASAAQDGKAVITFIG
jgi:hypothetical protein